MSAPPPVAFSGAFLPLPSTRAHPCCQPEQTSPSRDLSPTLLSSSSWTGKRSSRLISHLLSVNRPAARSLAWLRWMGGKVPVGTEAVWREQKAPAASRCPEAPEERKQSRRLTLRGGFTRRRMNRPETIPPASLLLSAPRWTEQMRFICKSDWLPQADTSCGDRATPSQEASSSPFSRCPDPLAAFLLATKQVQKGRGIRRTLPLFPQLVHPGSPGWPWRGV